MPFVAGYNISTAFRPAGTGSFLVLPIVAHSWQEMVDKLDLTNSTTQGLQALLAGVLRGDGNVKSLIDTANLPAGLPYFIRAGSGGDFQVGIGSVTHFNIPAMITKVNYQGAVEGKVEYDFDISLSVLSGSGLYIYPS